MELVCDGFRADTRFLQRFPIFFFLVEVSCNMSRTATLSTLSELPNSLETRDIADQGFSEKLARVIVRCHWVAFLIKAP